MPCDVSVNFSSRPVACEPLAQSQVGPEGEGKIDTSAETPVLCAGFLWKLQTALGKTRGWVVRL